MIRQIRYFQSVVRNNSFSEAAQQKIAKTFLIKYTVNANKQEANENERCNDCNRIRTN